MGVEYRRECGIDFSFAVVFVCSYEANSFELVITDIRLDEH